MSETTPGKAMKRKMRSLIRLYLPPILPFVIFLCRSLVGGLPLDIPKYILPSPAQVVHELTDGRWRWFPQILTTSQEVLGGFVIAVIVGVLLGLVVSGTILSIRTLMPILIFFNSMPKVAAAPLVVVPFAYCRISSCLF